MKTLTAVDTSTLCKVTNSSSSDILVALPIHSNEIPGTDSIVSYNKDLEILQVSKSGHSIKKNDSDT